MFIYRHLIYFPPEIKRKQNDAKTYKTKTGTYVDRQR